MLIDLGDEVEIKVKVGSQEYKLREPTQADIEILQGEDKNNAFYEFVEKLGLPTDVSRSLGLMRLKKLADGLTGILEEKK